MAFLRRFLLWPFTIFYRLGLAVDRSLKTHQAVSLARPVVSVGNMTVGGTGKTPLLIKLVQDLDSKKVVTAILTRGYKGALTPSLPEIILPTTGAPASVSDETLLVHRHCPHTPIGVGADRVASAKSLLSQQRGLDVYILDDGFQHWLIKRDFDVVCVDATDPWGQGALLPAGWLREPLVGLSRANVIVLTRAEVLSAEEKKAVLQKLNRFSKGKPVLSALSSFTLEDSAGNKMEDLSSFLKERSVLALSAIGNPRSFEQVLERYGAKVQPCRYADHYHYTSADVKTILAEAGNRNAIVVTTEKDAVKLKNLDLDFYVLTLTWTFEGVDRDRWQNDVLNPIAQLCLRT